jgi:transposase InsO family protein
MAASMSRTGNCWDNAVAESFFGTLKTELTDRARYATHAAAHAAIGEYIENFYNLQRRQSHVGYVSPIEFEVRSLAAGLAA